MKPGIDEARAIFEEEHPGCSWAAWVRLYQTPPRLLLNDEVRGVLLFAEPRSSDGQRPADTWFVWYACGPIRALFEYAPYPLPYVFWLRRKTKSLHLTRLDRIRSLTMKGAR